MWGFENKLLQITVGKKLFGSQLRYCRKYLVLKSILSIIMTSFGHFAAKLCRVMPSLYAGGVPLMWLIFPLGRSFVSLVSSVHHEGPTYSDSLKYLIFFHKT